MMWGKFNFLSELPFKSTHFYGNQTHDIGIDLLFKATGMLNHSLIQSIFMLPIEFCLSLKTSTRTTCMERAASTILFLFSMEEMKSSGFETMYEWGK